MAADDPDIDEPYSAPQGRTLGGSAQEPTANTAESSATASQSEPEQRKEELILLR
jgi:hypothetical protein